MDARLVGSEEIICVPSAASPWVWVRVAQTGLGTVFLPVVSQSQESPKLSLC